jgi:transposase
MAGRSPVAVTNGQRAELRRLANSLDRAEADRARSVLLTLEGWTSAEIGQAFGVRQDTVRLWRSDFARAGVEALKTKVAAGPAPVKAMAALRVAADVLTAPVANRVNWTLPRLVEEIERREGVRISRSRLSVVLRKKGAFATVAPGTL